MNIFMIGAGYDSDGSHVTDLVTLGTCPYWVPFLRDMDAHLSAKYEWWDNKYSTKLNSFLFSRIKQVKKYAIESDESLALNRAIAPGKYLTWIVYPDFEPSDDEEDGEVEFVLALQSVDWGVMFFKRLDDHLGRISPSLHWSNQVWLSEQAETVVELAIPEEDFDLLEKKS